MNLSYIQIYIFFISPIPLIRFELDIDDIIFLDYENLKSIDHFK